MKKYKLVNSEPTEDWGWNINPTPYRGYTMNQLRIMYGDLDETYSRSIEEIIETWTDEDWDPSHGTWEEVNL